MSDFTPTEEQARIMQAAAQERASLMVTAYAGCGKTSTLELLARELPQVRSLAVAFNVKIKKELERRFPAHFVVKTLNGLGHGAWSQYVGRRCEVGERKLGELVSAVFKDRGMERSDPEDWNIVRQLVVAAQLRGLGVQERGLPPARSALAPDTQEEWSDIADTLFVPRARHQELCGLARDVLVRNVKAAFGGMISFDDQVYCPVVYGAAFPQFAIVVVDEAQDLSPLNHEMIARCAGVDGRLIVVGDPKQAIYAFRGADSASMGKLRRLRSEWIDLPLATTFRCPKVVVGRNAAHAPGFRAHEGNVQGDFVRLATLQEGEEAKEHWGYEDLVRLEPSGHIAMLCRNNAPLLSVGFKLLRAQVGVTMLGRDIGKGLLSLAKKLAQDDATPARDFLLALDAWRRNEVALLEANKKEHLAAGVHDRAECLIAVVESGGAQTAGALRTLLTQLFARDTGLVTLATGHRSKGLEWPLVVHLDPWRIPSKQARSNPQQMEQELNLRYVIETRAQKTLVEANVEDYES